MYVHIKLLQSCLTPCDPMDCSPPSSLSMGFSTQEYWSGLPFPSPGDLPGPGIEPASPVAPTLQVDSLLLSHRGNLMWQILSSLWEQSGAVVRHEQTTFYVVSQNSSSLPLGSSVLHPALEAFTFCQWPRQRENREGIPTLKHHRRQVTYFDAAYIPLARTSRMMSPNTRALRNRLPTGHPLSHHNI